MAWTAPASWSVSEIVIASKMNAQIRDNMDYLKGNAGTVQFGAADYLLDASGATTGSPRNLGIGWGSGAAARFYFGDNLTGLQNNTGGKLVMQSYHGMVLAGARGSGTPRGFTTGGATGDASVAIEAIGTGPVLQATGLGGGLLFLSANAVDGTLQTLAPAGTVTQCASFYAFARNNTGGGTSTMNPSNATGLNQLINFPAGLTDTVTIGVSAAGAITVQRTAGTNATHQVNMLVMYK